MYKRFGLVMWGVLVFLGVSVAHQAAHAMLLTETFIFVGADGNSTDFRMKNVTKKPEAYRLSWDQMRMDELGQRQFVAEGEVIPGVNDGRPYMFVSPRRMILQPDQMQHIRFMVRRTKDMPDGEYRAYIYLEPEKIPTDLTAKNAENKSKAVASAELTILTGYRFPVFFLQGQTTLNVTFSNVYLGQQDGRQRLFFTMHREGTRSALGENRLYCETNTGEKEFLGKADVKVFTELDRRDMFMGIDLTGRSCRALDLEFVPHKRDPSYTGAPMASARLPLGKTF